MSLGLVFAASGCGDDSSSEPDEKPRVCVPGTVYNCFRSGCAGTQACSSDGTSMSRCTCDPRDPEDAGEVPDASAADAAADASKMADAAEPAPPEQCDNDRDDDGDGDTDCADSECGARSCERSAAAGFSGPIALRSSEDSTPDCDGAFDERVFSAGEAPSAAAASCSACACTPAGSACAAFVNFETGSEAACGGTLCATSVNQSCAEIMPPCLTGLSSAQLRTALPAGSGSCTPTAQTPDKPEVQWERRVVGCSARAATRGGCGSDDLCLPKPSSADIDTKLCVWREGEHDCPAQRYTEKHVYFRDVDDTRGCSACACSGPNCSYRWAVFNAGDPTCSAPIIELTSAGQCVQVNPSADRLRVGASIGGDGACTPAGGASQGSVSGSEPVTVCCKA